MDGILGMCMLPRRLHDPTWIDFGTLKTGLKPIFDYTFYDTVSGWILEGFWMDFGIQNRTKIDADIDVCECNLKVRFCIPLSLIHI